MAGNEVLQVQASSVPDKLKIVNQWVCWRIERENDRQAKVPINPDNGCRASITDRGTWASFDDAIRFLDGQEYCAGIGFVLTETDDVVGLDLDDCRDPDGKPTGPAREIMDVWDSYLEVSPSGNGYRGFATGEKPTQKCRRGNVELYDSGRYLTVTGHLVAYAPGTIQESQEALRELCERWLTAPDDGTSGDHHTDRAGPTNKPGSRTERNGSGLDDETLIKKAMRAENGAKFRRLWEGDTSGYPSQSEADLALCNILAFWTGGDEEQIDRIFRRSDLTRAKWDQVHSREGDTYGEMTMAKAIAGQDEFYDPTHNSYNEATGGDLPADGGRNIVSDPTISKVKYALQDLKKAPVDRIISHSSVDRESTQVHEALSILEDDGVVDHCRDPFDQRRYIYYLSD